MPTSTTLKEWIVPRFWRAYSWLGAMASLAITFAPDIANFILSHSDTLSVAFPTLSDEHKMWVLLAGNVIVALARPIRQKQSMEQP